MKKFLLIFIFIVVSIKADNIKVNKYCQIMPYKEYKMMHDNFYNTYIELSKDSKEINPLAYQMLDRSLLLGVLGSDCKNNPKAKR